MSGVPSEQEVIEFGSNLERVDRFTNENDLTYTTKYGVVRDTIAGALAKCTFANVSRTLPSVVALSLTTMNENAIKLTSYHEGWELTPEGPKGGTIWFKTGGTGTPVQINTYTVNDANGDTWAPHFPEGVICPLMLGAKFDGVTDDTTALQASLDLIEENGEVRLPAGEALFTRLVLKSTVIKFKLTGQGRNVTRLKTEITSGIAIDGPWPDAPYNERAAFSEISRFSLIGKPLGSATGLKLTGYTFGKIIDVEVDDFRDCIEFGSQCYGNEVSGSRIVHYSGTGMKQGNFNHWLTVNRCQFASSRGSNSLGFLAFGSDSVTNEALMISNCDFESSTTGIQLRNGGSPRIVSCYFENNTGTHIRLGWSDRTLVNPSIDNCYFNDSPTDVIDWTLYTDGGSISDPHFLFEPTVKKGVSFSAGSEKDQKKSPVFINVLEEYVENVGSTKTLPNFINGRIVETIDEGDLLTSWTYYKVGSLDGTLTIQKQNGIVTITGMLSGGTTGSIYNAGSKFTPISDMVMPVVYGAEGSTSLAPGLFLRIKRNGQIILEGTYDGTSIVNISATYVVGVFA